MRLPNAGGRITAIARAPGTDRIHAVGERGLAIISTDEVRIEGCAMADQRPWRGRHYLSNATLARRPRNPGRDGTQQG